MKISVVFSFLLFAPKENWKEKGSGANFGSFGGTKIPLSSGKTKDKRANPISKFYLNILIA